MNKLFSECRFEELLGVTTPLANRTFGEASTEEVKTPLIRLTLRNISQGLVGAEVFEEISCGMSPVEDGAGLHVGANFYIFIKVFSKYR